MSEPIDGSRSNRQPIRRTPTQDDIMGGSDSDARIDAVVAGNGEPVEAVEEAVEAVEEAVETAVAAEETVEDGGGVPEAEAPLTDFRDQRILLLEQALEEREERLQSYIRAHRKAEKDFENFKNRMRANEVSHKNAAQAKVVERMLAVYDNLQRSLDASRSADAFDDLRAGVELVTRDFLQRLEEMGLECFDPIGLPFDPSCMEALGVVPVAEDERNGTVVMTMQPGFRFDNRELRPAKVQVGRKF
jgi:molecular chaperone GrpE (heat shock protein)